MIVVLVPRAGTTLWAMVAAGSAVVADENDLGNVYYEGNLYRAPSLDRWCDRALLAADRLAARYPTVARARAGEHDAIAVGHLDTEEGRVHLIAEHVAAVADWLAVSDPAEQLHSSNAKYEQRRELLRLWQTQPGMRAALRPMMSHAGIALD